MTGPEHYLEGERLLVESEGTRAFNADGAQTRAVQASAHFLAALAASHALHHHPLSTSWAHAIDPPESQP